MKKIECLREAARLLVLYLHVAEYLAAKRADKPIGAVLADCFGAAVMQESADLRQAEAALRQALALLNELSRDPGLRSSKVLGGSMGVAVDSRIPIEDAAGRISTLLDGDIPKDAEIAVRRGRWYAELGGCLLQVDFPSEQETGSIEQYEMSLMPNLMLALTYFKDQSGETGGSSTASMQRGLSLLTELLPRYALRAQTVPNPWAVFHQVLADTEQRLKKEIPSLAQ